MDRNKKSDSRRSENKPQPPPTPVHDPIEPDPMKPKSEESADSDSKTAQRPDLDWAAEHED